MNQLSWKRLTSFRTATGCRSIFRSWKHKRPLWVETVTSKNRKSISRGNLWKYACVCCNMLRDLASPAEGYREGKLKTRRSEARYQGRLIEAEREARNLNVNLFQKTKTIKRMSHCCSKCPGAPKWNHRCNQIVSPPAGAVGIGTPIFHRFWASGTKYTIFNFSCVVLQEQIRKFQ